MNVADFVGVWNITRQIIDHRTAQVLQGAGRATIADGVYREHITLTLANGTTVDGTRTYLWRDGAGGIEISFEDGRPFHVIGFDTAHVQHGCPPDQYDGHYDFTAFPVWTTLWRVKGPRKDYEMTTRYSK